MATHLSYILLLVAAMGSFIVPAHGVPAQNRNGPVAGNSSTFLMDCLDDDGYPHINDVPHSTDCNLFGKCQVVANNRVSAVPVRCPENTQFSLKTCKCEHPNSDDSVCFDPSIPNHQTARFSCACAIAFLPGGGYQTIGPEDRC